MYIGHKNFLDILLHNMPSNKHWLISDNWVKLLERSVDKGWASKTYCYNVDNERYMNLFIANDLNH